VSSTGAIVIGAGPAGLAVGACLHARGVPAVLVEREAEVGSSWRRHYERLHLHTMKEHSALPYRPWPAHAPTYPSRAAVVDYLDAYASAFALDIRFGEEVSGVRREGDGWEVETSAGRHRAPFLVVATGYNRTPFVPEWPGREGHEGTLVHSSRYKNGAGLRGKRVLVVGIGNSGAEIALDLWEHGAETAIAVRGPVHVVPRDLLGAPSQLSGILFSKLPPAVADRISLRILDRVVGDLSPWGLRRPAKGPMTLLLETGRVPLIDVGTVELVKQRRIAIFPNVARLTPTHVVFEDGREERFDLVVAATGYRATIASFLAGANGMLDGRGYPRIHGTPAAPGLCFVGFQNRTVGLINDIARDAQRAAEHIARRQHGRA
jgi:cation diffusion facilitator CzcD-associated flavoprotein CzcO